MAIKRDYSQESDEAKLERLLVTQLTVGGTILDRGVFYLLSQGLSVEQLTDIRERVRLKAQECFRLAYEDKDKVSKSTGELSLHGSLDRDMRLVDKMLKSWFSPWTRLAGEMEVDIANEVAYFGTMDEKDLSFFIGRFYVDDRFIPYRDKELKEFIYDFCVENKLDYTMLPEVVKSDHLEDSFRRDYPFCVADMEWDLLSLAYCMGRPREVNIQEEPGKANGYIGGRTSFQSYLELNSGPDIFEGKVSAVGQIDYKDCTNAFVLVNTNERAVQFEGMRPFARRSILERIWDSYKNGIAKGESVVFPNGLPQVKQDFLEQIGAKPAKVNPVRDALSGKRPEAPRKVRHVKPSL